MILTRTQMTIMEEAAIDADASFRDDYSGRGMMGKTCIGITGRVGDLIHFVLNVSDNDKELADKLADVASDSMGYEYIYYWPHLQSGGIA